MTDYSFAKIGRPISLRVADGPPLEATLAEFAYRTDEAGGVSAEAVIEVSPADWSRVDSERLFHLEPDTRGADDDAVAVDDTYVAHERAGRCLGAAGTVHRAADRDETYHKRKRH